MAEAQRKLHKMEKGTPERVIALKVVQSVLRESPTIDDFVQKVSPDLMKAYDLIAFEDLNIKGMILNHCLAKHKVDAAWNNLITTHVYKGRMGWQGC